MKRQHPTPTNNHHDHPMHAPQPKKNHKQHERCHRFLTNLIEACRSHKLQKHSHNKDEGKELHHSSPQHMKLYDDSDNEFVIHQTCRKDLQSLGEVLPQVERELYEHASHLSLVHVRCLCALYNDIMGNSFCTHAGLIFQEQGMRTNCISDNFRRVVQLVHLFLNSCSFECDSDAQAIYEVSRIVAGTIGRFIVLGMNGDVDVQEEVDGDLQRAYVRDIVYLMEHVTALLRMTEQALDYDGNDGHENVEIDGHESAVVFEGVFDSVRQFFIVTNHLASHKQDQHGNDEKLECTNSDKEQEKDFNLKKFQEWHIPLKATILRSLQVMLLDILAFVLKSEALPLASRRSLFRTPSLFLRVQSNDGINSSDIIKDCRYDIYRSETSVLHAVVHSIRSAFLLHDVDVVSDQFHQERNSVWNHRMDDSRYEYSQAGGSAAYILLENLWPILESELSMDFLNEISFFISKAATQQLAILDATRETIPFDSMRRLFRISINFDGLEMRQHTYGYRIFFTLLDALPHVRRALLPLSQQTSSKKSSRNLDCIHLSRLILQTIESLVLQNLNDYAFMSRLSSKCNSEKLFLHLFALLDVPGLCSTAINLIVPLIMHNDIDLETVLKNIAEELCVTGGFIGEEGEGNIDDDISFQEAMERRKRRRSVVTISPSSSQKATVIKRRCPRQINTSLLQISGDESRILSHRKRARAQDDREVGASMDVSTHTFGDSTTTALYQTLSNAVSKSNSLILSYNKGGITSVIGVVTSSGCACISAALRLIIRVYMEKRISANSCPILHHLLYAIKLSALTIKRACCTRENDDNNVTIGPKRVKKIIACVVGAALEVRLASYNVGDAIDVIAGCILSVWDVDSILLQQSTSSSSLDPMTEGISGKTLARRKRKCETLSCAFCVISDCQKHCLCCFDKLETTPEKAQIYSYSVQNIECALPLNARCFLLASFLPSSSTKILEFVDKVVGNINCLPTFIIASIIAVTPFAVDHEETRFGLSQVAAMLKASSKHETTAVRFLSHQTIIAIFSRDSGTQSISHHISLGDIYYRSLTENSKNRRDLLSSSMARKIVSNDIFGFVENCPIVRLVRWCMVVDIIILGVNQLEKTFLSKQFLEQIYRIPFLDNNYDIQIISSDLIGPALYSNEAKLLYLTCLDGETKSVRSQEDADHAVLCFCHDIEDLLRQYCGIDCGCGNSESSGNSRISQKDSSELALSRAKVGLKVLTSLCEHANIDSYHGIALYNFSLRVLFRCWAKSCRSLTCDPTLLSKLAFSELNYIQRLKPLYDLIDGKKDKFRNLLGDLFPVLLHPSSSDNGKTYNRYYYIVKFIDKFLIRRGGESSQMSISSYFESILPGLIKHFILQEDSDNLLLCCAGFRINLRNMELGNNSVELVADSKILLRKQREDLCKICVERIEDILPGLLLEENHSCLGFLLTEVLSALERITLPKLILHRELKVLRKLVIRVASDIQLVGLDAEGTDTAFIASEQSLDLHLKEKVGYSALCKASVLRFHEDCSQFTGKKGFKGSGSKTAALKAIKGKVLDEVGHEKVSAWIRANFMYLLATVVLDQFSRFSMRNSNDDGGQSKLTSMKTLFFLLHYLDKSASPQYIPQVLSAVNAAISIGSNDNAPESLATVDQLRLLSVRCLSKFVHILLSHRVSTVGDNLSSIVVSLFPVLIDSQRRFENKSQIEHVTTIEAVRLLEFLISGSVSSKLVSFFRFIPFLPANPLLRGVRRDLKSLGFDFDDSDSGIEECDHNRLHKSSLSYQTSFQQRILVLSNMIQHESAHVRRAVLSHVTDLIKKHRRSFQRLFVTEQAASMRFLTVINTNHESQTHSDEMKLLGNSTGAASSLLKALFARCANETDSAARKMLPICLGEIGAVDPNYFVSDSLQSNISANASDMHQEWRLDNPPWKVDEQSYMMKLITNHLVASLKAASSTQEQTKVAFAIQEMIVALEEHSKEHSFNDELSTDFNFVLDNSREETSECGTIQRKSKSKKLGSWLKNKLKDAGVLEVIEPFAATNYKQQNYAPSKKPPFFRQSSSYFSWLASLCRFLIERSHECEFSCWDALFQACRAAIRSPSAVNVAEYLLPLLVLDGLCFGKKEDRESIFQEIRDVLSYRNENFRFVEPSSQTANYKSATYSTSLCKNDYQKTVNTIFTALESLEIWCERHEKWEVLEISRKRKKKESEIFCKNDQSWPISESIKYIKQFKYEVPYILRATAAVQVGMYSRAMRYLEMNSRLVVVGHIFDDNDNVNSSEKMNQRPGGAIAPIQPSLLGLAQYVLGQLSDVDALAAIGRESNRLGNQDLRDQAHQREVKGDWSGALQIYEQLLQLRGPCSQSNSQSDSHSPPNNFHLQRGMLRSLLELGQLESVINQIGGVASFSPTGTSIPDELAASATEASWRLSRWSLLEDLIAQGERSATDDEDRYQISLGKAMLGLQTCSKSTIVSALDEARLAVMTSLSNVTRESYNGTYPLLVRLHTLREIENSSTILCSRFCDETIKASHSDFASYFQDFVVEENNGGWKHRLNLSSHEVIGMAKILNVRLGLARFAGSSEVESDLWLTIGKRARKQGLYHIAETALAHAKASISNLEDSTKCHEIEFQLAKVKYSCGETSAALMMLEQDEVVVDKLLPLDEHNSTNP